MSFTQVSLVVLSLLLVSTDAASVCFSMPSAPAGSVGYSVDNCGVMPDTGYPVGHHCSIPSDCAEPSLSQATCLDGGSNNEGYWSQPVCTVATSAGFSTTKTSNNVVTVASDVEYAALVHLPSITATTHMSMDFTGGALAPETNSSVIVRIYTLQDPVGAVAGPGDLMYTTSGIVAYGGGLAVDQVTGAEFNNSVSATGGTVTIFLPTPLLFGNDYYVSVSFGNGGLNISMDCLNGAANQFWTRANSQSAFVSTTVTNFACVVNDVFVLSATSCQPTLLTATIGYGDGADGYGQDQPAMPYLDFTRSGFVQDDLQLKFTYPLGVYDDIQFLPYSGVQAFGPTPAPVTGDPTAMPAVPPCGTTFQTIAVENDNCEATATVSANFIDLIKLSSATAVCGWTKSPSPVAYQGVFYTQYVGQIQIVTYQTVASLGSVNMRIQEAYANVVVRAPIVTSNATASPTSVTDAAVFQWTIINQNLGSDSVPYTSVTNIQTRTSAGYNVTATASITSSSTPTPWSFNGATSVNLVSSGAPCTSAAVSCVQSWTLVVTNADTAVCSLDAIVTVSYETHCGTALSQGGGCDNNVDNRVFVTTVVLSSADFCKVVGGVTSLTMDSPTLHVATTDVSSSSNALAATLPPTPSVFVVGSSIGVYFHVHSNPAIPITITATSAKIYNADDRSQYSTYADVTSTASPYFYAVVNSNSDGTAEGFFNLPTGQSSGVTYTPWLLTDSGTINTVIVSVTASVSYDNVLLGDHFITFEVPITLPSPRKSFSPLAGLVDAIRAVTESIQTGTISQESTITSVQSSSASAEGAQNFSTAAIAGVAAGGAVGLFVIVAIIAAVITKRAAGAAVAYAPTRSAAPSAAAAAPADVPKPARGYGGSSVPEGFFAPRIVSTDSV